MKIGDKIKKLREDSGLNQMDLCSKLSVEQSTLANYENNRRVPKNDILILIADFFSCSLDYLLRDDANLNNNSKLELDDADQAELVKNYKSLDEAGKSKIHKTVVEEMERIKKEKRIAEQARQEAINEIEGNKKSRLIAASNAEESTPRAIEHAKAQAEEIRRKIKDGTIPTQHIPKK